VVSGSNGTKLIKGTFALSPYASCQGLKFSWR